MDRILQEASQNKPKISIITPMYNVADFIESQISSLVQQTLEEIEIILIDDGSTDQTLERVTTLGKKYPEKITVISKTNGGASSARNVGLNHFKGDYVFFADADDIVPKDSLENLYKAAIKHQSDITTGRSLSFNSVNSWYIPGHYNSGLMNPGVKHITTNPELLYSLGPASKLFKREIIEDLRMPTDIEIGEDQPFILEALLRSQKIYTIDKIVYNYRSREADEASLSQILRVDPVRTFRNISKSLKLGLSLFDKYIENELLRNKIENEYFNRVVRADLWPAIIEGLKERNGENQKIIFNQLNEMQNFFPKRLFGENLFYFQIIVLEFIERFTFIQDEAKASYVTLMKDTMNRLEPSVVAFLEGNERLTEVPLKMKAVRKSIKTNSSQPIFIYLVKRKTKKFGAQLVNKIRIIFRKAKTVSSGILLRRILFPYYKTKKQTENVLFLTNKDAELAGSFMPIYQEIRAQHPEIPIKCYFKKNKRNFGEMKQLLKDVATAKVIFLDDYYRQLYGLQTAKETEVVQVWHAAGAFKKFGFSSIGSLDSNTPEFETRAHQNYTKVICSSEEIRPFYGEAFNVKEENVLALGTPRADKLFDESYREMIRRDFFGKHPEIGGRKVITYAPTFRGGAKERQKFINQFDIRRFRNMFSDEYILVVKMHPSVKNGIYIYKDLSQDVLNLSNMDMNDLLLCTDILITDYSSVIFDYSILKKPMIFYAYDLEDYMAERSFYYDYESFVPGPIVRNNDELLKAVRDIEEVDLNQVEEFSNRFFVNQGNSAEEVVKTLMK
ncbi:bifunctional glycosyltransferase/CDP-glycerol:glycerophosphate glycerophosphotransferase [Vagococcus fluvialis]|uniref:bifunctional glycosyltransferase/CDP-glycerol:glycerophosphate glycerophosphotransferase n=1 Tax=Vagococcus fluvialis TaxID=2738 RepID=UPI002033A214|nr:CDP-glycerol glycerophosphotransferase family protein [Vagococcus fluvialis]MCM2138021.1 CDP-glycerol glycerophosphotransferase family protein [Vagococcus fluvialis]